MVEENIHLALDSKNPLKAPDLTSATTEIKLLPIGCDARRAVRYATIAPPKGLAQQPQRTTQTFEQKQKHILHTRLSYHVNHQ